MSDDLRADAVRAATQIDLAAEVRRVVYVHDVDLEDVGEGAGLHPSAISRWCSRRCKDAPGLVDVVMLGRDPKSAGIAHELLSWAADRLGLVVAKRFTASAPRDHVAHAAKVTREIGEMLCAYSSTFANDATLTDTQISAIDRELADAEREIASLRRWVDDERDRRAPVRAIGKGRAA